MKGHPGKALPGWSLGYTQEGGYPYARLETESGRFTATWYVDGPNERAYVAFNEYVYYQSKYSYFVAPPKTVGWLFADEVVGQCLLFDTKEGY